MDLFIWMISSSASLGLLFAATQHYTTHTI